MRRILLSLCLLISGCAAWPRDGLFGPRYTFFRVSDVRGEVITEWIARGWYFREGDGYQIVAIQRTSGAPYSQTTCYPGGWRTKVNGPNIQRWPVAKPEWVARMELGLSEQAPTPVKPFHAAARAERGSSHTQ
jgi:hypothetical protein